MYPIKNTPTRFSNDYQKRHGLRQDKEGYYCRFNTKDFSPDSKLSKAGSSSYRNGKLGSVTKSTKGLHGVQALVDWY
jgi:hypothetical protein